MSITNLTKGYLLQWKNWSTQWINNTDRTWRELGGNAITNSTKTSIGETWATITTDWASEDRTWLDVSQLINNYSPVGAGFLWSLRRFPWTETTPWLTEGGITNINKPI